MKLNIKDKKKWMIGSIVAFILVVAMVLGGGDTPTVDSSTATDISSGVSESVSGVDVTSSGGDAQSPENGASSVDTVTQSDGSGGGSGGSGGAVGGSGGVNISSVPAYSGSPYVAINNNVPTFSAAELTTVGYERYSSLDSLGRCGVALASCGREIMPATGENRGDISSIKPSGWVQARYDIVSGGYLYNRCHLIGWQLSAENANNKNLITGTRYMNTEGMLPFENMIADYIDETGNHVAYRVTPIYSGSNLVASGVQLEAYSVEDDGDGICFNVYVYNVQPGVTINYATGASYLANNGSTVPTTSGAAGTTAPATTAPATTSPVTTSPASGAVDYYVLNTSTHKFHRPGCWHISKIIPENYAESTDDRDSIVSQGYDPCGTCDP